MKLRSLTTTAVVLALVHAGAALAYGGDYVVHGGTAAERGEVTAGLDASAFDWNVVPAQIEIHITRDPNTYAVPGQIWIDGRLLDTGRFAWAVLQHEYAHQVDFFLFDDRIRAQLNGLLHGTDWWGLSSPHRLRGDERFASTLAWSYWPSPQSALRPSSSTDESAAMRPSRFRALMARLLGVPPTPSRFPPRHAFSFAPPPFRPLAFYNERW
jgi:hypothetical protein